MGFWKGFFPPLCLMGLWLVLRLNWFFFFFCDILLLLLWRKRSWNICLSSISLDFQDSMIRVETKHYIHCGGDKVIIICFPFWIWMFGKNCVGNHMPLISEWGSHCENHIRRETTGQEYWIHIIFIVEIVPRKIVKLQMLKATCIFECIVKQMWKSGARAGRVVGCEIVTMVNILQNLFRNHRGSSGFATWLLLFLSRGRCNQYLWNQMECPGFSWGRVHCLPSTWYGAMFWV